MELEKSKHAFLPEIEGGREGDYTVDEINFFRGLRK